jgi:radical SAM superfamily enzyme YgiQ (UPF0313 family)
MGKVAVLFPPLRVSRDFIDYPYFANLGALAAAALVGTRHEVELHDALARAGSGLHALDAGWILLGCPIESFIESLGSADLFLVAYTPFHRPPTREPLLAELLSHLRRRAPATPVLLCDLHQTGQHFVDAPSSEILNAYPEVDVLLRYEAENELLPLVDRVLREGRPAVPHAVNGSEVEDLDALPLPAWDRIDVESYFRFHEKVVEALGRPKWAFPITGRTLPLLSSRGCPFRCAHCSSNPGLVPGAPKRQRRFSAVSLGRSLDLLKSRGARRVHFLDELANVNERHFDTLLELCSQRDLAFEMPNGLRADYVLDKHLRQLKSRVTTLSVSAESGVPRVVSEVVGKELDLDTITSVAARAAQHRVPLLVHYMIGLPGETRAEMNTTLGFALDLFQRFGAEPSVQFATPLPGTRLARMTLSTGRSLPVVEDWGPRFQQLPTELGAEASAEELSAMRAAFEAKLVALREPRTAIVAPSYQCNNRCGFCATGTRAQIHDRRVRELIVRERERGARWLELDGGEPTLHPELFQLIEAARSIGYERVTLVTNARRAAYPEYAKGLARAGLTHVRAGLQGATADVHDRDVAATGAFGQTVSGIRHLLSNGLELEASVTLTRNNHESLDALVDLVSTLGVGALEVRFMTSFGPRTLDHAPETNDAVRILREGIERWKTLLRLRISNLPWCFLPEHGALISPDRLALGDHVVFASSEGVSLFQHLANEREHRAECETCVRRSFCAGFWRRTPRPEPRWLLANAGADVGIQ